MHRSTVAARALLVVAAISGTAGVTAITDTAAATAASDNQGGTQMKQTAKGAFDVKVVPVATAEHTGGTTLGRFSLDKVFHGDLEATSAGEMLTAGTAVKGSAGYVAIERVEGTLAGRKGTFVLQHLGSMSAGGQNLTISVVPDSGTGELQGLAGTVAIEIEGKAHFYRFDYTLP
jgi:hypothetical protein